MSRRQIPSGALAALLFALAAGRAAAQSPALIERASVTSQGDQAELGSVGAAVSADGSTVAFGSTAANLVPSDRNGAADIFVHDRFSGRTSRVSVASDGAEADNWSYNPALSSDGRLVVFESDAGNLVPGDTNAFTDIFVHDRDSGTTRRVSVGSGGAQSDLPCYGPAISADGAFVAFQSYATTLVPGGIGGLQDVYVHELATGRTTRESVTPAGTPGNGSSWAPALSGDGRFLAFSSQATDIASWDYNHSQDIFVRDRVLGLTRIVSVSTEGVQAASTSLNPALSGDGRFVAFVSWAKNLVPGDTNGHTDVFVHDRFTARTERVSVSSAGQEGDNHSGRPRLSWNGRFVSFHSHSTDLVAGDTNEHQDVFVRDRLAGRTLRVSVNALGEEGDVLSLMPSVSADGATVVFESHAQNLVPDDTNAESDVFVVELD